MTAMAVALAVFAGLVVGGAVERWRVRTGWRAMRVSVIASKARADAAELESARWVRIAEGAEHRADIARFNAEMADSTRRRIERAALQAKRLLNGSN